MKRNLLQRTLSISFHLIFWLWNLTFLTVVYAGILPVVGISLIQATLDGDVPIEFLGTLVALMVIPVACTALGLWRFRQQSRELMRLFYGVEAPLLVLCLVRLFLLRELNPASGWVLGTVLLAIAAFAVELIWGYQSNRRVAAWLQMAAHSLMLLVGIYVGTVLLYYAVPVGAVLIYEFLKFDWAVELWRQIQYDIFSVFWWVPVFGVLFFISASLFLAMPSALTALYIHSGVRVLGQFAQQYRRNWALKGSIAVIGVWLVLCASLNVQPQGRAFSLLSQPSQTDSQRQALLNQSEVIRKGLINANLYPYRYLAVKQDNNHVEVMYKNVFNLPDQICETLQASYNALMSPFLYAGDRQDVEKSTQLYAQFFDTPIQKAERKAVQHALQSTAIIDQAKAGLINIDEKRVWLKEQQVSVKPHGDWADIELYEVYENKTTDVEEVLYYFSLPESAVITGLWLGETDELATRFPFQVSPRGAAQQVYNSQVQRARPIDPALLEQVGPQQYRLRAFPVPPPLDSWERRNGSERPTKMHLWMTYQVMRQEQGWALPQLSEKRNIFWTGRTTRLLNGQVQPRSEEWLEAYIPAESKSLTAHQANFSNGYRVSAQPLTECQDSGCKLIPQGKRFAIVLDTSRSMAAQKSRVNAAWQWLKDHGFADNQFANSDADLYLTKAGDKPQRIDDISTFSPQRQVYYGSIQPSQMLHQFEELRAETAYDQILLLTDEGSYELSEDDPELPNITTPVSMVHLGGFPSAYNDAILKAVQDKGGVAQDIPTVMQQVAVQEVEDERVNVADGYLWKITSSASEGKTESEFAPLAARQLIQGVTADGTSVEELDALHTIAKTQGIVTPYSSMIVLVNDEQRRLLKEAEAQDDRFEREVETGEEQLTQPFTPFEVSATPEPEEWMLLGLGAIFLVFLAKRKMNSSRA
ncbi:MAG: TIGR02921 family PEP-CTERM protein [Coleofasciculaceae cyanobacterium]